MITFLTRFEADDALRLLAGSAALIGRLDAMIDGIAYQMDQRVGQILDHRLVDLGLFTNQSQFDILAQLPGQVARDARILLEQAANRLHARLHDRVLQVRNEQVELADGLIERLQRLRIRTPGENVRPQAGQPVLGEADFPRQVEYLIEPRRVHTDGRFARGRPLIGAAPRRRGAGSSPRPVAAAAPLGRKVRLHLREFDLTCRLAASGGLGLARNGRHGGGTLPAERSVQRMPIGPGRLASARGRGRWRHRRLRCCRRRRLRLHTGLGDCRQGTLQIGAHFGGRRSRLPALGNLAEHLANTLRGCHDGIHQCRCQLLLAIPQLVEQVLGQMAKPDQLASIQKACAALDRMKSAEDVVQQTAVVGTALEIAELVVDIRQQVSGFLEEVLQQVFHTRKIAHREPPRIPDYRAVRRPAAVRRRCHRGPRG
ncbi:MAG: hypothetical protein AW07_00113 [Candidatus Accumulibacter sp. SK-11]|nr:MAG: hypothetical protein AW07_00113 [Candidatus Accumulibacter sp. SK-11]